MRKKLIYLAFFCGLSFVTVAQDTAYARGIIKQLTSPAMYGRGVSHGGDSLAADFLAGEMRRLGVLPLAVNYRQYYTYNTYGIEGDVSLTINGKELEPYREFRVCPTARAATPARLEKATWKKQLKDGTWLVGVPQLSTYGPLMSGERPDPVCVEVLDTAVAKKVKKVSLELPLRYYRNHRSQNVVGYVRGTVDTMVVFTAHYDHCGTMGDNVLFPGAHDNASGVAAVLDLARMATQRKPYYTQVFMLFSGEESGLLGSKYAAENPLIDFSKVKLLCNIDMFCGGDEGMMVFNANSPQTKPFVDRLRARNAETHAAAEIRGRDNSPNSDHYWFSNYCPVLFLLTMGQPYGGYHDPADTCDACGLGHYNSFMDLIQQLSKGPYDEEW